MKKIIEQLIKLLVYTTFFVPLVLVPSSFIFPFIVPKIIVLRSLITVMLGGYAILLMINWQEYRPQVTPLTLALMTFIASFALSTFIGVDPYHSFWDNHERMLGLFTIMHYGAYYLVCGAIFKNWTDWKWALRAFLCAGSIVMFLGLLQIGDRNFLLNQGSDRIGSTLGNAIYVGGYALFLFFVAALLFLKEKALVWRLIIGLLGILSILGLLYSGTRGSVLGLVAGVATLVIGFALVTTKDHPRLRQALWVAVAAGVLLLGALYVYRQNPIVQKIPTVGRLLGTSFSGGTVNARFIAWNIAWEGFKARPIFGWGPNNFFYTFNQYYNPRSLELGYGETWFDNAHNIILNTLVVQGLVGVLAYLGIFAVAFSTIIAALRHKQLEKNVAVVGLAFLVAHLIQNITVFENPTSYLYFMFWLSLINRLATGKAVNMGAVEVAPSDQEMKNPDKAVNQLWVSAIGGVVLMCIFIFNIQPARANMKTLAAMNNLIQDPLNGLASVNEALQFSSPHVDDIRSDLSRMITDVVNKHYQKLTWEQNNELLNTAKNALSLNLALHPPDIRLYMMLAQLNQLSFAVSNDPRYLLEAEQNLEIGLTYSPKRQQLRYMLSTIKAQLGRKDQAIELIEGTISDDPKIAESYWRLMYTHYLFGDLAKAKEVLDLAKQRNIVFDGQGQQVEALVLTALKSGTRK